MPPLNILQQHQDGTGCSHLLLLFVSPVQGSQGQQVAACLEGEAGGPGLYAPLVPGGNPDCCCSAPCLCLQHTPQCIQYIHSIHSIHSYIQYIHSTAAKNMQSFTSACVYICVFVCTVLHCNVHMTHVWAGVVWKLAVAVNQVVCSVMRSRGGGYAVWCASACSAGHATLAHLKCGMCSKPAGQWQPTIFVRMHGQQAV